MKTSISVVVPIYNSENYLGRCIDSILAQTFQEFELLLMNDGSTDGSLAICEAYVRQDPRVRVYSNPNRGLPQVRKASLELCNGRYVAFVDSDDRIDGDYLLNLFNAAEKNNADLVCCNYWDNGIERLEIAEDCVILEPEHHIEAFWKEMMYANSMWGKLFRREILSHVKFEKIQYAEDVYVVTQVLHNAAKTVLLRYVGYDYLDNPMSMTRNSKGIKRETDVLVFMDSLNSLCWEKYPQYMEQCDRRWAALLFNLICVASTSDEEEWKEADHLVRNYFVNLVGKKITGLRWWILRLYLVFPKTVSFFLRINRKIKRRK